MSLALPRSADLRRSWRLALAGTFALAIVIAVITAGNAVSGIGGSAAEKPIRD